MYIHQKQQRLIYDNEQNDGKIYNFSFYALLPMWVSMCFISNLYTYSLKTVLYIVSGHPRLALYHNFAKNNRNKVLLQWLYSCAWVLIHHLMAYTNNTHFLRSLHIVYKACRIYEANLFLSFRYIHSLAHTLSFTLLAFSVVALISFVP